MKTLDLFGNEVRQGRKNFSRNNLGQRHAGDFYQTPPSMVIQFLEELPIISFPVLEPACGSGAITTVLKILYGADKVQAYDIASGTDFLVERNTFPEIITNPPFSLATEFILKCKEVAQSRFSLLLPIDYLHGKDRYRRVFSVRDSWGLAWLHVFTRRASMDGSLRADGKYRTGMITWAWYTWIRYGSPEPKVCWIDNDAFVLRKESGRRIDDGGIPH